MHRNRATLGGDGRSAAGGLFAGESRATARWLTLVVVLAVVVNLALLALAHLPAAKELVGDEKYYFDVAAARASGEDRGDDPFWPPLYALLLTGLFEVVGPSIVAVQIAQVLLWLVTGLLWYRIARFVWPDGPAPLGVLAILLLSTDFGPFAHYVWPEILHATLLAGAIALLVPRDRKPVSDLLAGMMLGLSAVTKLVALPWMPLLVVFAGARVDGPPRRRLVAVALLVAGLVAVLAPVTIGNARAGRPLVASSAIFNIWLGLNDPRLSDRAPEIGATELIRYRASGETPAERNAAYRALIARKIAAEGVWSLAMAQGRKQYQRLLDHDTFFVEQLPGGDRSAYRFNSPALRTGLHAYADVSHALLLIAAACGLALLRCRPFGWPQLFAVFLAYNLGLFLVLHVTPRFLVQMVPFMALLGGAPLAALNADPARGAAFAPVSRGRLLLAAALATVFLLLAFASKFAG